jgi:hypothetical protein
VTGAASGVPTSRCRRGGTRELPARPACGHGTRVAGALAMAKAAKPTHHLVAP